MSTEATPALDELVPTPAPLLALDEPRVIRLTIGKLPIDFQFNPIAEKDWRRCMEAVVTRVEQKGDERIRINDEGAALAELFTRTIFSVSGYKGMDGLTDAQACARVPLRHRVGVAQILRNVSASTAEAEPTLSDLVEILLECPWTTDAAGNMQMFSGLIHRFRQPTLEQYRRWRMGVARSQTSGDAQDGVTIYPSRLAVALGLYDEMIAEVEGYSFNRAPLTDLALIREQMDGMHKARAVLELFDRSEEDITLGSVPPPPAPGEGDDGTE